MTWTRQLPICALTLCSGCGAQRDDEIPPALLDAIASGSESTVSAEYPEGPYGSKVGDIAHNVCFSLWSDPKAAGYREGQIKDACLSDFWDPEGAERRLLLVNTAALWCQACRLEYGGTGSRPSLSARAAERESAGFAAIGVLFQNAARDPATTEDAIRWATTFEVDFPFGLDPDFEMGRFASESVQPFNMLVDAQTMKIVLTLQGDEPDTLWPTVDGLLEGAR